MNKIEEYGNLGLAIAKLYEAVKYLDKVKDDEIREVAQTVHDDLVYSINHIQVMQDRLKDYAR